MTIAAIQSFFSNVINRWKPVFPIREMLAAVLFVATLVVAPVFAADSKITWLWVRDENTGIGIPGASIDLGPEGKKQWTARYETGRAGRVLVKNVDLPGRSCRFDCRVTLNGRELPWHHTGGCSTGEEPAISEITITVDKGETSPRYAEPWTSDSPTQFRGYVDDEKTLHLIPNAQVRAVNSGIRTTADADGLFTIEIPATYRKGKSPGAATETLVFTKPGYKKLEYRQLVLNAGLGLLDVSLQHGAGMLVWKNLSRSNGGVSLNPEGQAAEILSLEITPSRSPDGAWILFRSGAKAIVKARNLTEVEIDWYPMGTEIPSYATEGKMKKVRSGPDGDTWELELSGTIMSTNFWAQGTDINGKTVKSMDFGNVATDDTR